MRGPAGQLASSFWYGPVPITAKRQHIRFSRNGLGSMANEELWKEYIQSFYDMRIAIGMSGVISAVNAELFAEFPRNLTKPMKTRISRDLRKVAKALLDTLAEIKESTDPADGTREKPNSPARPPRTVKMDMLTLSAHMTAMHLAHSGRGGLDSLDFRDILNSQQLVMCFAILEGFMSDSVRVVCVARRRS